MQKQKKKTYVNELNMWNEYQLDRIFNANQINDWKVKIAEEWKKNERIEKQRACYPMEKAELIAR